MKPTEIIGNCSLYLGDCREVLPHLPKVDLVLTDPPYGIGASKGTWGSSNKGTVKDYGKDDWDNAPIDDELLGLTIAAGTNAIIFGGNYFNVPPSPCWLVWDKENTGDFADAELAWTNLQKAVRLKRYMWNGMLRANNEQRGDHPTQKPIGVMQWALDLAPKTTLTVADPFAGSGTTGVACVRMGKTFYGIEREPKYFDIMCERIMREVDRPQLFPFSYGTTDKDKQGFQSDSQLQLIQTSEKV